MMPVLKFNFSNSNKKEAKNLHKIVDYFNEHRKKIDEILGIIFSLTGTKENALTEIKIHFKSSQEEKCEGWTTSNNSISIKCPKNSNPSEICLLLIPHEIFHLVIWQNKNLTAKIDRLTEDNSERLRKINFDKWKLRMILEELLISSFVPEGYLAEKFLNLDVRKKARKEIAKNHKRCFLCERYKSAQRLYVSAKEYVENKKRIDQKYLEAIVENLP